MGKTRKNKHNITRKTADTHEMVSGNQMEGMVPDDIPNSVLSLIEKLKSPSAEERQCACSTACNLLEDGAVKQLLSADVVLVLAPLVNDASQDVSLAALGVLRNMTVDGMSNPSNVCEKMIGQGILTPIITLLQKYGPQWKDDDSNLEFAEIFHQAIHVLWNLCESCPEAVQIVNENSLLPLILPSLLPSQHGYSIAVTVAQCINTMSEDNPSAASLLSTPEAYNELSKLLMADAETPDQLLHSLLIAGILCNICKGDMSSIGSGLLTQITILMLKVLQGDILTKMQEIATFIATLDDNVETEIEADSSADQEMSAEESDAAENIMEIKHKKLDGMMRETRTLITAQQLAVQLVANFCCSADDEEGWEDAEMSDSGGEDIIDAGDNIDLENQDLPCLPSELQKVFVESGLITKVFQKLKGCDKCLSDMLSTDSQSDSMRKSFENFQLSCLLCTSNLVDALEVEDLGGAHVLEELWTMLSQLAGSSAASGQIELLEGATSALRAVVSQLDDIESTKLQHIEDSDIDFLCRLGTESSHCPVRVNAIRISSILGGVMTQNKHHVQLKKIGEFLLQVSSSPSELLWVIAEALDAVMDVFSADDTDPVVKEMGLVMKLKELLPVLKLKAQQQKRHLPEHKAIISTAKSNLIRFIKYKSSRLSAV